MAAIVKIYLSFLLTSSDALLITLIRGILAALEGNLNYPTPAPTLAVVTDALNAFIAALAAAAGGGVTLTSIKNNRRADLVTVMRKLAAYVQLTCDGDLTVLLSSGFPIQKPQREPVGDLPAPSAPKLSLTVKSGQLAASIVPTIGASSYNWSLSTADAPDVVLQPPKPPAGAPASSV